MSEQPETTNLFQRKTWSRGRKTPLKVVVRCLTFRGYNRLKYFVEKSTFLRFFKEWGCYSQNYMRKVSKRRRGALFDLKEIHILVVTVLAHTTKLRLSFCHSILSNFIHSLYFVFFFFTSVSSCLSFSKF